MYLEPFQQHEMIGNELKVPYSIDTHFLFQMWTHETRIRVSCTSDIFNIKSFSD